MTEISEREIETVNGGAYTGKVFWYTIQPGDCLSVLAQKYNTTVPTLCSLNKITNPNFIRAYDKIMIPYKG